MVAPYYFCPSRKQELHCHCCDWEETVTVNQSGCVFFKAAQIAKLSDLRQVSPDRVKAMLARKILHDMLHVISARCGAHDLHTIALRPLERTKDSVVVRVWASLLCEYGQSC